MITIITGGARSGKSTFAESLLEGKDEVCYIATAHVPDEEMKERVRLHRERRNPKWRTYEGYDHLEEAIGEERYYLLDCVTLLVSRVMFEKTEGKDLSPSLIHHTEEKILSMLENFIGSLRAQGKSLIMVTNEVGDGPVPMDSLTRAFRDMQGRVNQRLASLSDRAYLVVMGLEVRLK